MSRNDNLIFEEPKKLLRVTGHLSDSSGNTFEIIVTGSPSEVREYIAGQPIFLEIKPIESNPDDSPELTAAFLIKRGVHPQTAWQVAQELRGNLEEEQPNEEANIADLPNVNTTLEIEIKESKRVVEPPYILHFEVDPNLPSDQTHEYIFQDSTTAKVTCEANEGNVDMFLQEFYSKIYNYVTRDTANAAKNNGKGVCEAHNVYSGYWKIQISAKHEDSKYTLSGDLTKIGIDIDA